MIVGIPLVADSEMRPLQALNPKLERFKTFEEAAHAVDDMFNAALQSVGGKTRDSRIH